MTKINLLMRGTYIPAVPLLVFFLLFIFIVACSGNMQNNYSTSTNPLTSASPVIPDADNAGLKLPTGFNALTVADNIGPARHLAVASNGNIYVKLAGLTNEKGIILLRDTTQDGKADVISGFANYGGTGIYIKDGYLYASSDEEVFRYQLNSQQEVINPNQPEKIITGLINRFQHASKSIVLDNSGNIYVNIGAYSNNCQEQDRTKGSPGISPCPILEQAGGIWKFRSDVKNQTYSNGTRYATGLRNTVGLDWNKEVNQLFVIPHGRDQLYEFYPNLYSVQQGNDLPSEALYMVKQGDDAGWPYIYYDQIQHKKILSPEYGGDGKKTGGTNAIDPVVAFPGHLAPNGLLFYTGNMFPEKYKNGAFIAFHGSWNVSGTQRGYYVAFVPFKNGKPTGDWEIFADNFSGVSNIQSPADAKHRPCGLAQGPDGSLYISDDAGGRIYRIIYK